ncbi:hypothetical protein P692DRAFT_20890693 [Suillus brevipes Sb2]|nr:hypothetical protein P692DRAFT_20890693 [Suillus brevipes Sb2]
MLILDARRSVQRNSHALRVSPPTLQTVVLGSTPLSFLVAHENLSATVASATSTGGRCHFCTPDVIKMQLSVQCGSTIANESSTWTFCSNMLREPTGGCAVCTVALWGRSLLLCTAS